MPSFLPARICRSKGFNCPTSDSYSAVQSSVAVSKIPKYLIGWSGGTHFKYSRSPVRGLIRCSGRWRTSYFSTLTDCRSRSASQVSWYRKGRQSCVIHFTGSPKPVRNKLSLESVTTPGARWCT